jgi:ubiquinone/menaquinone biosynthesis C-methylase UbiE
MVHRRQPDGNGAVHAETMRTKFSDIEDATAPKSIKNRVADYLERANSSLSTGERHPDVFNVRAAEFVHLLDHLPQQQFGIVADVGCGNGFMSALWSLVADEVIGVDESEERLEQHSIGLERPQNLIGHLGAMGVSLREGKIEKLPFNGGSLDVVFTSYVLEHVMDLSRALAEIARVLKRDGIQIHIVPDLRDKIASYRDWILEQSRPRNLVKGLLRPFHNIASGNFRRLPYAMAHLLPIFPPPAHDLRKSFLRECWEYRSTAWERAFNQHGLSISQKMDMPRKTSTAYILHKV